MCSKSRNGWIPAPSGVAKPSDKYSKYASANLKKVTNCLLTYFDTIRVA